jgi:hypothetical protein
VSFKSLIIELNLAITSSMSMAASGMSDFLPLVHFSNCIDGNVHAPPTVVVEVWMSISEFVKGVRESIRHLEDEQGCGRR